MGRSKGAGAATPPAESPPPFDFEHAMSELEALVTRLEQGEVPLEEALAAFERGIALTRACQQALSRAEQKVELLMTRADGSTEVVPFEAPDDDEAE
jgi:exodeoxyribonuclease VII small subunit